MKEQAAAKLAEVKLMSLSSSNWEVQVPWRLEELHLISNVDIVNFLQKVASENFLSANGLDGRLEVVANKLSKSEATKLYKTLIETKQYQLENEEEGLFSQFPRELCTYVSKQRSLPLKDLTFLCTDFRLLGLENTLCCCHGL